MSKGRWVYAQLEQAVRSRPAVALLGARQVGKTTLAHELGAQMDKDFVYLDLESPEDLAKLQDGLQFFRLHANKLIILDEIQRVPEIFAVLRGVIDANRREGVVSSQFLLLGSASMDLLRQSSESLAGRIRYVEMTGFNLLEVTNQGDGGLALRNLWLKGGFPEVFLMDDDKESFVLRQDLIRTYLERDIPQFGFKIPAMILQRLWTMLAHLQGEGHNQSELANNLSLNRAQLNHYVAALEGLLLLRRLEPWYVNTKKRLVKSPRFYVRDSGLLHTLLGIKTYDALLSNPVLGKSWEGFVVENIFSVKPSFVDAFYYRSRAGAEIDLVLQVSNDEIWAIEIKFGLSPKVTRGFHQACEDINATRKYVVYGGEESYPAFRNTTMISLKAMMQEVENLHV